MISISILFFPWPWRFDRAIEPERINVSVEKNTDGYNITILELGDYEYLHISDGLKWRVVDSKNRILVSSGTLLNISDTVWLNENQPNGIMDVGESISIHNPNHVYGNYYFILVKNNSQVDIIHTLIPA